MSATVRRYYQEWSYNKCSVDVLKDEIQALKNVRLKSVQQSQSHCDPTWCRLWTRLVHKNILGIQTHEINHVRPSE